NDLVRRQIELSLRGGGADLSFRTNQHWHDKFGTSCFHGAEQRRRINRMDNRGTDWIETACHLDQAFIASPLLPSLDFRENDALALDFFGRFNNVCGAGDHLFTTLVRCATVEDDSVGFFDFFRYLHRHGDGVPEAYWSVEML